MNAFHGENRAIERRSEPSFSTKDGSKSGTWVIAPLDQYLNTSSTRSFFLCVSLTLSASLFPSPTLHLKTTDY